MFKTILTPAILAASLAAPAFAQNILQMPTYQQTVDRERAAVAGAAAAGAARASMASWQTDAMLGRPVAPPQVAVGYANALAADTYNMVATYNPSLPYGGQFPGAVYAIPQPQPYYLPPGAGGYPVGGGCFPGGGGGYNNTGWGVGVNAGVGGGYGGGYGGGRNYDYNNTNWGIGVNGGVGGNSGSWGGGGFNNLGWGVGINGGIGGNSGSFRSW